MARWPISEWGCIIDEAQNQKEKLIELIIKNIERRDPPGTSWRREEVKTKGLAFVPFWGKKREFLTVRNKSKGMKNYTVDVNVEPYGNTLAVHSAMNVWAAGKGGLQDWQEKKVSWEDQTVLSDWASVIFRCVREACRELIEEVGDNPEKLKAETKGILSVW